MRIGILTLPLNTNYGGILQAWALQTVLERMGHDVWVIDKNMHLEEPGIKEYSIRLFKKILYDRNISIFQEKRHNKFAPFIRKNTNEFINKYLKRKVVNSINQLDENIFDAIVVGSDQVWRPEYFVSSWRTGAENSFLSFAKDWDIIRISYAASFGTNEWEYSKEDTEKIQQLAKKFDAISVREKNGVKLCKEQLGVDSIQLLDPTMLLTKDDYDFFAKQGTQPNSKVMHHILDPNPYKSYVVKKIEEKTGFAPSDSFDHVLSAPPVENWIRRIKESEIVITDSFHACVFSILYHKKFIAIANESRGKDRFLSLLATIGLEERLLVDGQNIPDNIIFNDIDYLKVDNNLANMKQTSYAFLKQYLV